MNFTTKITAVAVLATGTIWAAACGSSSSNPGTGAATVGPTTTAGTGGATTSSTSSTGGAAATTGTGGMMMPPPPPKLGTQIDRLGRPAVNTVGSKTFNAAGRDASENAYNADDKPAMWVANHKADIAADLGV